MGERPEIVDHVADCGDDPNANDQKEPEDSLNSRGNPGNQLPAHDGTSPPTRWR